MYLRALLSSSLCRFQWSVLSLSQNLLFTLNLNSYILNDHDQTSVVVGSYPNTTGPGSFPVFWFWFSSPRFLRPGRQLHLLSPFPLRLHMLLILTLTSECTFVWFLQALEGVFLYVNPKPTPSSSPICCHSCTTRTGVAPQVLLTAGPGQRWYICRISPAEVSGYKTFEADQSKR